MHLRHRNRNFTFTTTKLLFILFCTMTNLISCCTGAQARRSTMMENGLPKESGMKAFWNDAKARFGFKSAQEPLPRNDPFYGCNSTVEELKKGDYSPGALLRKRGIYLTIFSNMMLMK